MNISLIGYGQMGQMIEKIARLKNLHIQSIIDPSNPNATHRELTKESLQGTDIAIEFSTPESALENIQKCAEYGINIVVGTTGWYKQLEEVKKIVKESNIGLVYASNFSIGVNIFYKIIRNAAQIMNKVEEYDIFAHEWHHKRKKDSPSGTAISIGNILIENIMRKDTLITDKLDRAPKENELHFSSTRGGEVPGTHAVYFDSEADTIELKHTARSRGGFALGAVKCALWLKGKRGFFTVDDWIQDELKSS